MSHRMFAAAAVVLMLVLPVAAREASAQALAPVGAQALVPVGALALVPVRAQARLFEALPLQADVPSNAEPQVVPASAQLSSSAQVSTPLRDRIAPRSSGPVSGGMWALYTATIAMQALDYHSTMSGLRGGAVEANPLMSNVTKNRTAFLAVKAAVATGAILAARSIAKRNKLAAVVMLVAVNSAYAYVAMHNYKVAGSLR
ncbi:MAG: DUF5658 family protein [Acidobacteria bacterium]|nr:DUF5658 family protein [Acidobacteriota bacterium]